MFDLSDLEIGGVFLLLIYMTYRFTGWKKDVDNNLNGIKGEINSIKIGIAKIVKSISSINNRLPPQV